MKLFAYGSTPKDAGTYTFYQNLRMGLRQHGWNMVCVTTGRSENASWSDAFADDGCVRIATDVTNLKKLSMEFTNWCVANRISVVMPANSRPIIAALPHLPTDIRAITRCTDSDDAGYRRATYSMSHLSSIVATTPRHVKDLPQRYSVQPKKISLIPHGVDWKAFVENQREESEILRITFIGRLHHQKGVLYIPDILRILEAQGVPYLLTIAGSGIHQTIMEEKIKASIQAGRVTLLGTIPRSQIPDVMGQADILLFLSHHEGFGFVLLEGMAAGCVPVASLLPGVTDFVVEEGKTGFLRPVGDVEAFARTIIELHRDRERLRSMGFAAVQAVRERFSLERMAADYARLMDALMKSPPIGDTPRPWDQFTVPKLEQNAWHSFIPRKFKQFAWSVLFRLR